MERKEYVCFAIALTSGLSQESEVVWHSRKLEAGRTSAVTVYYARMSYLSSCSETTCPGPPALLLERI